MSSKHGLRKGRTPDDDSSDSGHRDKKRKHDKADKKDKDRKQREPERRREPDRKGDRTRSPNARPIEVDARSHGAQAKARGAPNRGGDRQRSRSRDDPIPPIRDTDLTQAAIGRAATAATPSKEEDAAAAKEKAKGWRNEVAEADEDERDMSDDDDATERKLAESRRRREEMMKKAKEEAAKKATVDVDKEEEKNKDKGDDKENSEQSQATSPKADKKPEAKKEAAAGDMFDMSDGANARLKNDKKEQAGDIGLTGASGDDWDDGEGYYIAKVGEILEERYSVYETVAGRGVFSNVCKAKDKKARNEDGSHPNVAIKIIRSNDMMKKAAEKEIEILQLLNRESRKKEVHVIKLLNTFYYRKHIFLVFECMWDDLRAAVKKFTKGKGMTLQAVKAYTKQLLIGVRHMHKCGIVHADLKPDNILISENNSIVKLCDFGTAVELKDISIGPYVMSRFYRPPEVILACEYGFPVDVWALACTLAEIFTGKVLLNGKTNNDQLKKIMDLKGKIPVKVIKKGHVWKQHFEEGSQDFKYQDTDNLSGQEVTRIITDLNAKKEIKDICLDRVGKEKQQSSEREDQQYVKKTVHFADLLDKMLALNPENRATADEALKHHFLAEAPPKQDRR